MQKLKLKEILLKYEAGECTEDEKAVVETFYLQMPSADDESISANELMTAVARVGSRLPVQPPAIKMIQQWPRIIAAAVMFIVVGIGYFILFKSENVDNQIVKNRSHSIVPGRNQATLTLSNGEKIILTKGMSGKLAQQGSTIVGLNNQNEVSYSPSDKNENQTNIYNTLSTATGEQSPYPLILSDGSKVWLNAKSSITFPVAFNRKERVVKITGEAYVEVAHNAASRFKVKVKNQIIEDIGTRFNINGYDDEPFVKTVLLEGKVKVIMGDQAVFLDPGKQAIDNDGDLKVQNADTEGAVAWKNGYFNFVDTDIKTIMRVISRWYNIDVEYQGQITNDGFEGKISKFKDISQVLNMLSSTELVHFKVEGRRVIVSK